MKNFTVYNLTKKILRSGTCADNVLEAQGCYEGEFVIEGTANDITQKVEFDGLDGNGQPINPRVVDKTQEEIEQDNPTPEPVPFEKQRALITNEQFQEILNRLEALETEP